MPRDVVLDASALLALVHGEEGADVVEATIPGAQISAVNLAEVVGKLADIGMPEDEIRAALAGLGLRVVDFDERLAFAAGLLRPLTRSEGLSLGDRACLAVAAATHRPALTADRSWAELGLDDAAAELIR
jgi:PIN domain nuclease of toxin-antitoxin system